MKLMAVHVAVEDQLIWGRALEGEACFPVFVAILCERKGSVVDFDGGSITGQGVVHALERHPDGNVKDDAPPALYPDGCDQLLSSPNL